MMGRGLLAGATRPIAHPSTPWTNGKSPVLAGALLVFDAGPIGELVALVEERLAALDE